MLSGPKFALRPVASDQLPERPKNHAVLSEVDLLENAESRVFLHAPGGGRGPDPLSRTMFVHRWICPAVCTGGSARYDEFLDVHSACVLVVGWQYSRLRAGCGAAIPGEEVVCGFVGNGQRRRRHARGGSPAITKKPRCESCPRSERS